MTALTGLPVRAHLAATAACIASCQAPCGAIAWETEGQTAGKVDVWDHVECAMALTVAGLDDQAEAAYRWLAAAQRPDGTWPREWRVRPGGALDALCPLDVVDATAETNMCAYVAVGVWHHWCARADRRLLAALWPTVCAALDTVVAAQLPFGGIAWALDEGVACGEALLAGSASIHHALRCGARLADVLGTARPDWELAADTLATAIRLAEPAFLDKARFSMDWYYPVLGGALSGGAARARLTARWEEFVVPGLGIRCVADRPWVTGAETCELAIALTRLGDRVRAARLIADMQHLREECGAYHTGYVYPDDEHWPIERSSWTGAAMLLAVDALRAGSPTARTFGC